MIPLQIILRRKTQGISSGYTPYPDVADSYFTARHVAAQQGNYEFSISGTTLYWSDNEGNTTTRTNTFADAGKIEFAYIFPNGNLLFATGNKMYQSTNQLVSYSEISVIDIGGGTYSYHTPANASYPGSYFRTLNMIDSQTLDNGNHMIVWTNYTAYLYGASPVNIYYSINGESVKIAYKFGQNPYYRDNGTSIGGSSGTLLGDSGNSYITRHGHFARYDKYQDEWYVGTGDQERTEGFECHWMKSTYNQISDSWSWSFITSVGAGSRFKTGAIAFDANYIYIGSDQNLVVDGSGTENGIFRTTRANLLSIGLHDTIIDFNNPIRTVIETWLDVATNTLMVGHYFNDDNRLWFMRADGSELKSYDFDLDNEFCAGSIKNTSGYYTRNTRYMYNASGQPDSLKIKI